MDVQLVRIHSSSKITHVFVSLRVHTWIMLMKNVSVVLHTANLA